MLGHSCSAACHARLLGVLGRSACSWRCGARQLRVAVGACECPLCFTPSWARPFRPFPRHQGSEDVIIHFLGPFGRHGPSDVVKHFWIFL